MVAIRRINPVELRLVRYFHPCNSDGWKIFVQGGPAINLESPSTDTNLPMTFTGRAGFGYRVMLDNRLSLDLTLSLQECWDHPGDIYAPQHDMYHVTNSLIRRSDSKYSGVCLSISLNY